MRGAARLAALAVCAAAVLVLPPTAAADHATRPHTPNMHALGHSPDFGSFLLSDGQRDANSDLAFWDDLVFHGDYDGFRILRTRWKGDDPRLISRTRCNGDQGDIVVWRNILVRAWNSPKTELRHCDGTLVPAGFEGMHIFDISDLKDPKLVGEVELSARPEADSPGCGTHTLTLVPDRRNRRVIIYNATSGGNEALPEPDRECDWIDIVQVPLDDPAAAGHVRREPLMGGHAAHDNGAILGDVNLLATASGHMSNVFDIGDNAMPGGSLTDPVFLYTIEEEGVCNTGGPLCNGNWHSAAFTWDGEVIILGWEPGGGSAPECEATDPPVKKSAFFYDADTGAKLGQWTLPRAQSAEENCTIHNYNTVPLRNGRYVLVSGNYQAGTWVTDFTNPASPVTLGWSDPPPLVPTQLGGVWSSYWYNGLIYESEITKGLNIFRFTGRETRSAIKLPWLNPQTQEFSIDIRGTKARGRFHTLPAGAAMGLEIGGFAAIKRTDAGTKVKAVAWGLAPRTTYAAHLHNAPCSAPDPGGGHYKHDPAGPSMPPNELWLSSTGDPMAGITTNAGGVAYGRGSADWIARPEAQSVVIHYIPPGGTTAGGPKIACADLL